MTSKQTFKKRARTRLKKLIVSAINHDSPGSNLDEAEFRFLDWLADEWDQIHGLGSAAGYAQSEMERRRAGGPG
jgi:hypothetical protein